MSGGSKRSRKLSMHEVKKCLVLSPHYDDAELGCGGTIAKLIRNGAHVRVMVFAEQRRLDKSMPERLEEEMNASAKILGFDGIMFRLEGRRLGESRQAILDDMIQEGKDFQPDLVLAPSLMQTHQDHQVVSHEAFRAFKYTSLLGYDMPWNYLDSGRLSTFVEISKQHLAKKAAAVQCYASQMPRPYFDREVIESLARARGLQCGRKYAEAFETYRWFL